MNAQYLLAVLMAIVGAIYITPGALPVSASLVVYVARLAGGFGMVTCALSLFLRVEFLTLAGLAFVTVAYLAAAWAIMEQPCDPKK